MSDYAAMGLSFAIANKEKQNDNHTMKVIKTVILILSFIAIAEFCIYIFIRPMFRFPQVEFFGNKLLATKDLEQVIQTAQPANWLGYSTQEVSFSLSKVPAIQTVSVKKTSPGKIAIQIKEREPVAVTTIKENGRTITAFIDRNGIVFKLPSANISYLPIISGLPMEFQETRAKVPATYKSLLKGIADLLEVNPACFAPISEICVKTKKYGNYELVLHPVDCDTCVFLDKNLNPGVWQYVLVTLDVIQELDARPDYIDLRYGSVSLGTKQG